MKKFISVIMVLTLMAIVFTGCDSKPKSSTKVSDDTASTQSTAQSKEESKEESKKEDDSKLGDITVISREDGSGTRGAFIEIFGIEEKNDAGDKVDNTINTAEITNNTAVMMTTVADDVNAIGYISLGSMNDSVKALQIDGVEATAENVKSGTYTVSRPFNIATKDDLSDIAQDFIDYILSSDGQQVVEDKGYIKLDAYDTYKSNGLTGKVTVAGSSSVTPVMEALKEAYLELNPDVEIEIQQSDSTTGMNSVIEDICDIGMASRDLKDSELDEGLVDTRIAIDGIAVIANNDNSKDNLTKEQVKDIYTGIITAWNEI